MTAFITFENISGIKCLHVDNIIQGISYNYNYQDTKYGYEMYYKHYKCH